MINKEPPMDLYRTFVRANHWLVALQERRIPQALVAVSGFFAILLGALFLLGESVLGESPVVELVTNAVPSKVWVIVFLLAGAAMVTLAIARYHWSAWISLAFSAVMFGFAAATIVDDVESPATWLVAVLAIAYGALTLLSGVLAIAKINENLARRDAG